MPDVDEIADGIHRIATCIPEEGLTLDECGALNDFLELAPAAEPLHSDLGAGLNGSDFAVRPVRTLADGQVLDLGGHRLRILVTPHVPHGWCDHRLRGDDRNAVGQRCARPRRPV